MPRTITASLIGIVSLLVASPAAADNTPECNDGFSGPTSTECGTDSLVSAFVVDGTALGANTFIFGSYSTAVGTQSIASVGSGGLLGFGIVAGPTDPGATALGAYSFAGGIGSVAIGAQASTILIQDGDPNNFLYSETDGATAIGGAATVTGFYGTAVGALSSTVSAFGTAVGSFASADGELGTAIGAGAEANAFNSVALGVDSIADEENTVSVGSPGEERRITNLAAGVNGTDAVNMNQLAASSAGSLEAANAYTDMIAASLDFDIRETRKEARAGSAAALAAAGMPQPSDPGKSMIAMGVGTYRGRSAFAIGASHRVKSGKAVVKVGVTYDSSEHVGANAGAGFQF